MEDFTLSNHARTQMRERNLPELWVKETIESAERIELLADYHGNTHYLKRIEAFGNRWLRVILSPKTIPNRVVTVFFDRRVK